MSRRLHNLTLPKCDLQWLSLFLLFECLSHSFDVGKRIAAEKSLHLNCAAMGQNDIAVHAQQTSEGQDQGSTEHHHYSVVVVSLKPCETDRASSVYHVSTDDGAANQGMQ